MNKPTRWVTARYFGKVNPSRADKWIFGSRHTGFYLRKFAWTAIVRHRMVAGAASPDDPSLTDYWATRRRRGKPPVGKTTLRLLQAQRWRYAEGCCCMPIVSHKAHESGNSGLRLLARRSANTRSPCGVLARRTNASQTVSYTLTASAGSPAMATGTALLTAREAFGACLSRLLGNGHGRF